jgi:hypothetical protein
MAPVRRGGHVRTALGEVVTWSQAEGARGTRWREAIERDGQLVSALLLEVDGDDRPTRLEMTTRAGLLTLHPESDGSAMHGNVVGADGVRHLAFGWGPDHELLVLGSPAVMAIAVRRLEGRVIAGATTTLDVLRVDDALDPRPGRWIAERVARHGWHLRDADGGEAFRLTVEDDGRPAMRDEISWPLEV